jgi:hypothetical protein
MIGSRVLAAAVATGLVVGMGGGGPRPEVARTANAAIVDAADRTLAAIDRLQAELAPAVDAGRSGAARVVAGAEDPSEPLAVAAKNALAAVPAATDLRQALESLERARRALRPGAEPLPPAPDGGGLTSIAAQLDDAAGAGATFAETRRRAEAVSASLVDALEAAAAGELDEAGERLVVAQAAVEELRAWEDDERVLSVWIGTADAMIRAMQRLVDAVRADDPEEAEAAQADFDAAAESAPEADRALRIGVGEAGSALTAVPLRRLARVLAALDELEAAVRAARSEAAG